MTVYALVSQCALSVLSYSGYKIAKISRDFVPGPLREDLQRQSQTPQQRNAFSPGYARRKAGTPQKLFLLNRVKGTTTGI